MLNYLVGSPSLPFNWPYLLLGLLSHFRSGSVHYYLFRVWTEPQRRCRLFSSTVCLFGPPSVCSAFTYKGKSNLVLLYAALSATCRLPPRDEKERVHWLSLWAIYATIIELIQAKNEKVESEKAVNTFQKLFSTFR